MEIEFIKNISNLTGNYSEWGSKDIAIFMIDPYSLDKEALQY